jgi:cytochrome c oxidase cbb3-type subunit 2
MIRRTTIRAGLALLATGLCLGSLGFPGGLAAQTASAPTSLTPEAQRGQSVYVQHCVECHGEAGEGNGPAAAYLTPHPRNFALARYKIRSTETGTLPTDDDLLRSVRQGLYGTAMPGWQKLLSEADIRAVVAYIKTFSTRFANEAPQLIVPGPPQPASPTSVARGAEVYETLQCVKCHGVDGRGTGAIATSFEDDWGQPLPAADLTEPWTFRGGPSSSDIYMRFRAGMSGTPMPSFKDTASDADMWHLANFVVSLARKPAWDMTGEEVAALYAREETRARANPVARGAYLVDSLGCVLCHSPVDENKRLMPGLRLAGGLRMRLEPFGDYPTGNLTSDKETGLGNWTDEEIKQTITRGILKDGTRMLPYPMDWGSFSNLTASDLDAIVAYLRTVPPVHNDVPPPDRTFLPIFLWGKFKMLVLGGDPPMTFFTGNAGSAGTP